MYYRPGSLSDGHEAGRERCGEVTARMKAKGREATEDRFLPVDRAGMDARGWDACDAVIVTGDAYVDHPSFGAAIIGRHLESLGYRVGILAQPDWSRPESFLALGVPRLFTGITSGAMDSMVNHYTSFNRIRSDDAYTPGGRAGARPDRAVIVYANAVRRVMPGIPIVLGGIEASLRRLSHYDFWSDKIRRSVLLDSRADILVYGMGERQIGEIAARLSEGRDLDGISGTAVWAGASGATPPPGAVVLPSHEDVVASPRAFMEMTLAVEAEASPWCGRPLVQMSDTRMVLVQPPSPPLSREEMDVLYSLPFTRMPHPSYREPVPAWEMIRDSVTAVRGCAGGCSFCALGLHQGRHIVSRSEESVLAEVRRIAAQSSFRGTISDIGGPTANMYGLRCGNPEAEKNCRR
nr:YgiQ family radical SAM protein [Candidatus Fermentibacter daniensis]